MDQFVRIVVGVALFGGTGIVVLMALPKIVVWCLEIVDAVQVSRSRRRTLLAPHGDAPGCAVRSQEQHQ
jgi:hypothetical protein